MALLRQRYNSLPYDRDLSHRCPAAFVELVMIFFSLFALLYSTGISTTYAQRLCKSFPGTDSWPAIAKWRLLNDTLEGRLIEPALPGVACHEPQLDAKKCQEVQQEWANWDFHVGDPVSVNLRNWDATTCSPDPGAPCSRAGYPAYVANATRPEHVQAAVKFARKHGIRLSVKGTGHDFLGRSLAPGTLSIWTHHMTSSFFHHGEFVLTGSNKTIQGDALTAGAGSTMYELYKAAAANDAVVVGGASKSVGVGGYLSGGGHSSLSSNYGLGADNVLEIEVVTPQGDILVVNEDQEPDLFWALRGGGGSTFGVVTSITVRAFPTARVQKVNIYAAISITSSSRDDFLGFVLGQIPTWMDGGLRGYCVVSPMGKAPYPFPTMPVDLPGTPSGDTYVACAMTMFDKSPADVTGLLGPMNNTINSRFGGDGRLFIDGFKSFNSWMDWYDVDYDRTSPGGVGLINSWLLDGKALTADPKALVNAVSAASTTAGGILFFPIAGKGVQQAKPRGGSNAVNPAWRNAYVHLVSIAGFDPLNKASEHEAAEALQAALAPMRRLAPNMGAYINEAFLYEPDPARTFWGDNYDRLLRIKKDIDPDEVFWCAVCVGYERWEQLGDGRVCQKEN